MRQPTRTVGTTLLLSLLLVSAGLPATVVAVTPATVAGPASADEPTISSGGAHSGLDSEPESRIVNISIGGDARANTTADRVVLWEDGSFRVNATLVAPNNTQYSLCAYSNSSSVEPDCRSFIPRNSTQVTDSFEVEGWQADDTGPRNLTVELRSDNTVLDAQRIPVAVLQRDGDYDEDGLENQREVDGNTSVLEADTDMDGLLDGPELNSYGTDPTDPDTDDDGLPDAEEVDRGTDPLLADSDGDGLEDGAELSNGTDPNEPDTDDDSLRDGPEIEFGTNPLAANTDDDGIPDGREVVLGLDPTTQDTDGDMLDDDTELFLGTNPKDAATPIYILVGFTGLTVAVGLLLRRRGWKAAVLVSEGQKLVAIPAWARRHIPGGSPGGDDGSTPESDADDGPVEPNVDEAAEELGGNDDPVWTDRDEVLALLQKSDGRIKQREIVDRTDWSESKVSRTLSDMEDDKQISRIEIGREKIVTLYDEEPDVFSSN